MPSNWSHASPTSQSKYESVADMQMAMPVSLWVSTRQAFCLSIDRPGDRPYLFSVNAKSAFPGSLSGNHGAPNPVSSPPSPHLPSSTGLETPFIYPQRLQSSRPTSTRRRSASSGKLANKKLPISSFRSPPCSAPTQSQRQAKGPLRGSHMFRRFHPCFAREPPGWSPTGNGGGTNKRGPRPAQPPSPLQAPPGPVMSLFCPPA